MGLRRGVRKPLSVLLYFRVRVHVLDWLVHRCRGWGQRSTSCEFRTFIALGFDSAVLTSAARIM